eukprot:7825973-Pyramimonas_sp.AAC.1
MKELPRAAKSLEEIIDKVLFLRKLPLTRSGWSRPSRKSPDMSRNDWGGLGGVCTESFVNVGIDDTAGCARRARGRNSRAKTRFARASR